MCFIKKWPTALRRRWVLFWTAGAGILLVGLAVFLALHDKIILILSALLTLFIAWHCIDFYHIVCRGEYEAIHGVCTAVGRSGIQKRRNIRLRLPDGSEKEIRLDKRISVCVGNSYRLYLRRSAGSLNLPELPGAYLMDEGFLGLEDLGVTSAN